MQDTPTRIAFPWWLLVGLAACGTEFVDGTNAATVEDPTDDFHTYQEHVVKTADGVFLYFQVHGSPKATKWLIGFHGGPCTTSHYMEDSLPVLAGPDYRVVTWDQRGCGRSSRPTSFALDLMVEDVETIRRYLGVETWAILGHSWGGVVSSAYSIAHPERVERLVLYASASARNVDQGPALAALAQRVSDLQAAGVIPDPLPQESLPFDEKVVNARQRNVALFWDTTWPAYKRTPEMKRSQFSIWSSVRMNFGWDHVAGLGTLTMPVLVTRGDTDPMLVNNDTLIAALNNEQVQIIPNCGHYWQECLEAATAVVRPFLNP